MLLGKKKDVCMGACTWIRRKALKQKIKIQKKKNQTEMIMTATEVKRGK